MTDAFYERTIRPRIDEEEIEGKVLDLISYKKESMSVDELRDSLWQFISDSPIQVQLEFVSDLYDVFYFDNLDYDDEFCDDDDEFDDDDPWD